MTRCIISLCLLLLVAACGGTPLAPVNPTLPVNPGQSSALAVTESTDRPCVRKGQDDCINLQFLVANHTDGLREMLVADSNSAGENLLKAVQSGRADFHGQPLTGALFIWLKPEVAADPNWRMPGEAVRTFQFDTKGGEQVVQTNFVTNPSDFPRFDDPRAAQLGKPEYVMRSTGGTGGVGWSMPARLLDDIAYIVFCPYDPTTSYPDRRGGKSLGLHFTASDIQWWRSQDWEYMIEAVLVAQ